MSCLFAIGLQPPDAASPAIDFVCRAQRFLPVEEVTDHYAGQLAIVARDFSSNTKWFLAIDVDGLPDLDIAYDIPAALGDRLGVVITAFQSDDNVSAIDLLIYDLGSNRERIYDKLTMREMKQTLLKWYELGAPDCTVYHKFIRD
jgi:hypothetical protein